MTQPREERKVWSPIFTYDDEDDGRLIVWVSGEKISDPDFCIMDHAMMATKPHDTKPKTHVVLQSRLSRDLCRKARTFYWLMTGIKSTIDDRLVTVGRKGGLLMCVRRGEKVKGKFIKTITLRDGKRKRFFWVATAVTDSKKYLTIIFEQVPGIARPAFAPIDLSDSNLWETIINTCLRKIGIISNS